MYKNVASQKVAIYAWDGASGVAKTGDAANITAQISIDGGASAATNDANPTELDSTDHPGVYIFDLTQAETNGDLIVITAVSSTDNIVIRPIVEFTNPITPTKAGYIDHAISTVDTVVDAILVDTGTTLPAQITALNNISVADIIAGIAEGGLDLQEMLRIILAYVAGTVKGAGSNIIKFYSQDGNTVRIDMRTDEVGNRSNTTLDGS